YVLGVHDGFVAIFYNNEEDVTKVKEVTETPIPSLPPEERNKLEKGIKVYSEDELIRMLEDYTS
ncbi:MAG TPA: BofC C-terminal domain-containing protein, partial [Defluviitaleaceae bacterium]|nr:BofC C-terminal domain-containing protein [Defluviitaleaceae bacterium]